jgi:hypothetical protein
VDVAKVETRQLSNSELGRMLGLSASGASVMRRGIRFPSPKVQGAIVKHLGATWPELNAALVAGKNGRPDRWGRYIGRLTEVRVQPARDAEAPAEPGTWVQRKNGTWLKLA